LDPKVVIQMAVAEDRRRIGTRLTAVRVAVALYFVVLVGSFWFLQVAQYTRYKGLAENNHQRLLPLRAPRGVILDRHGRVLVENRNAFNISILREHSKDLEGTIRALAEVTQVPVAQIRETVEQHKREPTYRPIVVITDAEFWQVAAIAARRLELHDVMVEEVPTRQYPAETLAAHLFGYVGEASEEQVALGVFPMGAVVGQQGVEKIYNTVLMGQDGARRVMVNSMGREIQELDKRLPVEGRRVQLTIDLAMQKAAEDGFRHFGYNGAAIILEPTTGEVMTFVSMPAYDPNSFASGIDRTTWQQLNTDKLLPLQNRAIQGRYSPGSTFKLVVATAALESGLVTPDFKVHCGGGAVFYGRYFKCHLAGGHGTVDMRHAIEKSCNVYFYTLGNMLGVDRIHEWAEKLGMSGKTGIDLPNEVESLVPSTEWKKQKTGEKWYAGETISVAIGQGQTSITPTSLAVMMATLANGGTRLVPHLVKTVDEGKGWEPVPPPPSPFKPFLFKPGTISAIHDGLWMAVNEAGTAGRARIPGRDVAGKTGTAQVISIQGKQRAGHTDKDLRDHGWFVFMVPRDNPELAGALFVEHAEHGYLAAPIARHVIETYYAEKEGRPLPTLPLVPGAPLPPAAAVAAVATTAKPAAATTVTRPGGAGGER
jgi:penicillin-binding protein 2